MMKNYFKFLLLFWAMINCENAIAQAPQKISYQAIMRDVAGNLIVNRPIGIRISILSGSVSGNAIYVETQSTSTNSNGLMTIEIGGGTSSVSLSNVDWGAGPFFVKTETDPAGGSNFSIIGTSQILSVPYALYAESSKPQGKSTIMLIDDITDAQAREKISRELGPNTEKIYVLGTTALTTLDLSGAESVFELKVSGNSALTSLNVNNLKVVYGEISISDNQVLNQLNFNLLQKVYSSVSLIRNGLQAISFPLLKNAAGVYISYNSSLTSISLPAFEEPVYFRHLPEVSLYSGFIEINGNESLSSIDLRSLKTISDFKINQNPNLTMLSVDAMTICNSFKIYQNGFQALNFPELIHGNFAVSENNALTSVNLPKMKTSDYFLVANNQNLTNLSIPLFTGATAQANAINLSQNLFSSTQVNYILDKMVHFTVISGGSIRLNQTVPAPPTGQGIIDKQTLIANGNFVITD